MTYPSRPTLLVRADAAPEIGTGHVMRCLALAQAWQDEGGHVVFLMAPGAEAVAQRIRGEHMEVRMLNAPRTSAQDEAETAECARELRAAWTVLDGYHFDSQYRCSLSSASSNVLWIDDLGTADDVCSRIVLNTEIAASDSMYPQRAPDTRLLLGNEFLLVRREFLKARPKAAEVSPAVRNVLVTLGGSDAGNITPTVLKAIDSLDQPGLEVTAVIGPANSRIESLKREAGALRYCVTFAENADMPALMAAADMAVSAGGVTSREVAFMGLPQIVIQLADNQAGNVRELVARGAAMESSFRGDAGMAELSRKIRQLAWDPSLRRHFREAGRKLVDGEGARRVVRALQS